MRALPVWTAIAGFVAISALAAPTGPMRVTKAAAIEDVEQFFGTLERVHPNLLATISQADYSQLRQRTLEGITAKVDGQGQVAVEDMAYVLYYAAAAFHDGHTTVQWRTNPFLEAAVAQRFPAFEIGFGNGRFVIAAAANKSIAGLEVAAVNGTAVRDFLAPILDRCSGETLAFRAARFTASQPFWFYMTNLLGGAESIDLTLRGPDGNERRASVRTLDAAAYGAFVESARSTTPRPNQQGTAVEFLAEGKVAHFLYQAFRLSDAEKKKVDDIFRQIREKRSTVLLLDLRGNGGGISSMGDYLFAYIYSGKFRQFSRVSAKVSPEIRSTEKLLGTPLSKAGDGKVVSYDVKEETAKRPEAFFAGRKYLLTDNGTFSSASGFAAMFRDYKVGTILGYETGGLATAYGDVYNFSLKNSGISCSVSWKQFFSPKPRAGDDEHGVLPDVPIAVEMLSEFKGEADPALAAAVKYSLQQR